MAYYGGSLYSTEREALIESVYDFLTASGTNSLQQALRYATETRDESIAEARSEGWAMGQRGDGAQAWGVHEGSVDFSPEADFSHSDITAAFDAVADRLRREIAEDES